MAMSGVVVAEAETEGGGGGIERFIRTAPMSFFGQSSVVEDTAHRQQQQLEQLQQSLLAGDTAVADAANLEALIDGGGGGETGGGGIIGGNYSLAATISSIRTNVTRVLYMYFQNVTDEFGYGAATTTATPEQTTTAQPPAGGDVAATAGDAFGVATAARQRAGLGGTLSETAKLVQKYVANATATTTATTATAMASPSATTTALAASAAKLPSSTAAAAAAAAAEAAAAALNGAAPMTSSPDSITYPNYELARNYENCSALFDSYTQPQQGTFCNWTWDNFLCWPPTPAGVLARMHCPSGWHGIDPKKFANRKCELDGRWGSRPNETYNAAGWTDYQPCFQPEVNELFQKMTNVDLYLDIAKRTRTLEIIGLILSLVALIVSLIIFCNFRSLRNNRTKIHKNLFIAMVLQVIIRLTLYLDQAYRRDKHETTTNMRSAGIENTPYLCEASYTLLEYARTAMFMWMFIEGLYLHNMVTVAVFHGRFPHAIFSVFGWGVPVLMTTVWAICTVVFTDSVHDCIWNYNLTPYYWILEGPRLIVISLNFVFLLNIIRVLVVKLRQSQASDIEQTRKAVRAAIVLLPLLGITNLLHLVPDLETPWKFALWSYCTYFLTSFQGFFIALIYCFLNGEVRTVLLKSVTVYMSVRGHPEWAPKRASMFSGAYNTAPDTEAQQQTDAKRSESSPFGKQQRLNGRKASTTVVTLPAVHASPASVSASAHNLLTPRTHVATARLTAGGGDRHSHRQHSRLQAGHETTTINNNNNGFGANNQGAARERGERSNWTMVTLCFRGQKHRHYLHIVHVCTGHVEVIQASDLQPSANVSARPPYEVSRTLQLLEIKRPKPVSAEDLTLDRRRTANLLTMLSGCLDENIVF